ESTYSPRQLILGLCCETSDTDFADFIPLKGTSGIMKLLSIFSTTGLTLLCAAALIRTGASVVARIRTVPSCQQTECLCNVQ
ncbi:hypothetical protein OS493_035107, partial [Desmophyllum pertusum]